MYLHISILIFVVLSLLTHYVDTAAAAAEQSSRLAPIQRTLRSSHRKAAGVSVASNEPALRTLRSGHRQASAAVIDVAAAEPALRETSSACTRHQRKVLLVALDGTRGDIFYNQLTTGKLPSFKRLLNTHNGLTARCTSVFDPECARAHAGNRLGSTFAALGSAHNSVQSQYQWLTSPGWTSVLTGVGNSKHRVEGNDRESKLRYYNEQRHQYPTFLSQAHNAGFITAAAGSPHYLSSSAPKLQSILPASISSMLYKNLENDGILDFECTDEPDVYATESCNLHYRQSHLAWDAFRDMSSTVFARRHITGSNSLRPSLDGDQCADVITAHFDLIDHAGHHHGFGDNDEYRTAMQVANSQFGEMLADVENVASLRNESWLIIVTSDHGGFESSHGRHLWYDESVAYMTAVIEPSDISSRTVLQPLRQPIKHYDAAPTINHWLGVGMQTDFDGQVQGLT